MNVKRNKQGEALKIRGSPLLNVGPTVKDFAPFIAADFMNADGTVCRICGPGEHPFAGDHCSREFLMCFVL